jgi:acyl-coenzyme A thioesterase PaaI-like protein
VRTSSIAIVATMTTGAEDADDTQSSQDSQGSQDSRDSRDREAAADAAYGDLARAVASLVDASMITEVDLEEVRTVTAEVRALDRRLRTRARGGALGVTVSAGGGVRNHGNTVVGLRNPMSMVRPEDREVTDDLLRLRMHLGPAWEGPPGHVHGGVSALVLDQALGEAASTFGGPGMTGRLTLHYRRATPLGPMTAEAWLESTDGTKSVCKGRTLDEAGNICVEAEGLFIFPKWAADHPQWSRHRRGD